MSLNLINAIDDTHANVTVAFRFDGCSSRIDLESGNAATLRPVLTAWAERPRLSMATKSASPQRMSLARQRGLL